MKARHSRLGRNIFSSRFYVFQSLASPFQTLFTSQSPAQTVFSLQQKRIVISLHSDDVYLPGYLIFEPVPYFHRAASFLGDHNGLASKISLRNRGLPVLLFFQDQQGRA
jgi:hypothetical protein